MVCVSFFEEIRVNSSNNNNNKNMKTNNRTISIHNQANRQHHPRDTTPSHYLDTRVCSSSKKNRIVSVMMKKTSFSLERCLKLILLLQYFAIISMISSSKPSILVLIDDLLSFHGKHCREYCEKNQIELISLLSSNKADSLIRSGQVISSNIRAPGGGEEPKWLKWNGIDSKHNCASFSCSIDGLNTSLNIRAELNSSDIPSERSYMNRIAMQRKLQAARLPSLQSKLISSWSDGKQIFQQFSTKNRKLLLKKNGLQGMKQFPQIIGNGKESFLLDDDLSKSSCSCLLEDYIEGPEYRIDAVTKDGATKILAVWKNHKLLSESKHETLLNQCSDLINSLSSEEKKVCGYCLDCLGAINVPNGPSESIIRVDKNEGPLLIDLKLKWNDDYFLPLMKVCLGYDTITATLDSFFHPSKFVLFFSHPRNPPAERYSLLPDLPQSSLIHGKIFHLFSYQTGTIEEIRHLSTMEALSSVKFIYFPPRRGDRIEHFNTTTTANAMNSKPYGFVLMMNVDKVTLEADAKILTSLQKTMFITREEMGVGGINVTTEHGGVPQAHSVGSSILRNLLTRLLLSSLTAIKRTSLRLLVICLLFQVLAVWVFPVIGSKVAIPYLRTHL